MINAIVTRGFLFTPELVATAGYGSAAAVPAPEPVITPIRSSVISVSVARSAIAGTVVARGTVLPVTVARMNIWTH